MWHSAPRDSGFCTPFRSNTQDRLPREAGRFFDIRIYWNVGGDTMNPCELTVSVTAIANALACRLTERELALLGAVFTQLGAR